MNEIISREENKTTDIEPVNFFKLIDEYKIVIPRLQRDYALGRENEEEKRQNFLNSLKSYLDNNGENVTLDFTYGSKDEDTGILTLLDGQQRLTTLFLLHWYLSLLDGKFDEFRDKLYKNGKYYFTYDTRYSSTNFCKVISTLIPPDGNDISEKYKKFVSEKRTVQNNKNGKLETIKLSEYIKKEKWFLYNWNYDSTIKSMLNVLDSIDEKFQGENGGFEKLKNGKISFHFLELKNFGLSNELYVKMNSRGKQLTKFENLKAKILPLFDEAQEKSSEKYTEKLNEVKEINPGVSSLRTYFSEMIDNKWFNVFWNEWNDYEKDKNEETIYVDNMLMSFIFNFCIYSFVLNHYENGKISKECLSKIDDFFNKIDKKKKEYTLTYSEYEEILKENNYNALFALIDAFNAICDDGNDGKLRKYFSDDFIYFNEKKAFEIITNSYSDITYEQRVEYFAYLKYLIENKNNQIDKNLEKWMRFITNICVNSYQINQNSYCFSTSIFQIDKILYRQDIEHITEDDCKDISVFDKPQIHEEFLKINLSKNDCWKEALLNAEKELPYFKRNLYYPLHLTLATNPTDWNSTEELDVDGIKCQKFEEYIVKIKGIFADKEGCPFESSLIRAILSKGDYLTKIYQRSYSLLKNKDRDLGWTEFFRKKDDKTNNFKNCFYKVITDDNFDKNKVKELLDDIAEKRDNSLEKWMLAIIDCPEILGKILTKETNRYLRWNTNSKTIDRSKVRDSTTDKKSINCEIDILTGERITSKHYELFTLQKFYELTNNLELKDKLDYKWTTNEVEQPYILFNKKIKIYYAYDFKFLLREDAKQDELVDFDDLGKILELKLKKV
ncbi:MAG: DUF262 domain-containing protein [Bacteroidales bacterium]|nr:DUF262 domain-containing protein [Bacteroidales bacterium]